MKVEKKKAREERDLVLALEWRSKIGSERYFLLERRPDEGMR
jgi:A/G-specific adenine glycosylase